MANPTAARTASEVEAPERIPTVILFAETRGFTRMSEMLDPAVVLARVSEFFELISTTAQRHDGNVLDVLNDTVMATFTGGGDAQHAIEAAKDIQRDEIALAERWEKDYGIKAAVSVGIHSGDAVVGFTGGALQDQLLIFGDCVSLAERMLHRARAGEFVFSEQVMEVLAADGFQIDAEELPPIEIPRRDPIRIFGVLLDTRLDFT
jgi:adenylate cyclase